MLRNLLGGVCPPGPGSVGATLRRVKNVRFCEPIIRHLRGTQSGGLQGRDGKRLGAGVLQNPQAGRDYLLCIGSMTGAGPAQLLVGWSSLILGKLIPPGVAMTHPTLGGHGAWGSPSPMFSPLTVLVPLAPILWQWNLHVSSCVFLGTLPATILY